jgi:transmembrane sensor
MADERLEKELALARRAAPLFGLARQQRVIWGLRRRLLPAKFRARRVLPLVVAAGLATLAAALYLWLKPGAYEVAAQRMPQDEHWVLRDGSRVVIETPDTRITKQSEVDREVIFELSAGAARFDVAHRPERTFRVQAGPVQVEVIGTAFRVERQSERTLVAVDGGCVRVSWSGGSKELSAGEHGVFPLVEDDVAVTDPPSPSTIPLLSTAPPLANARPAGVSSAVVGDGIRGASSAEELFAKADRARAGGRPVEAAQALRELTQRFSRDARAPLAAFTLGRLLLENLHQPAEAARAFGQARTLSGRSSALAEDALAREAEAWEAAGNAGEAAKRAELYRTLYPNGSRLKRVLRAGGPAAP